MNRFEEKEKELATGHKAMESKETVERVNTQRIAKNELGCLSNSLR